MKISAHAVAGRLVHDPTCVIFDDIDEKKI